MKNFESALSRIKELEEENHNLKVKLKAALWKISSPSVEEKSTNKQVGLEARMEQIRIDSKKAMQRFTAKNRKKANKYREKRNGS